MKNKIYLSLSLVGALTCLAGCGDTTSSSGSAEPNPVVITDLTNREVTVDLANVNNVVCIGAGALRLYSYINGADLLSGVEDIDNPSKNGVLNSQFATSPRPYYMVYGNSYKELPSCGKGGPSNQAAEAEAIATCHPDVVFSEYEDASLATELQEKISTPVLTLRYDSSNIFGDSIKASLRMIGKVVNKASRAEELITYIDDVKEDLDSKTKDIAEEDKPSIYLGCLGRYGTQDIFMTCKNYPLFALSHIKSPVDEVLTANGFQNIDEESFWKLDVDKFILDASGLSKFKTTYASRKDDFNNLKAFQNGEVYLQMPYNNYYTNLEVALMDAYYQAKVAYPTVFSSLDIASKSNEISQKFLGKEIYSDMCELSNSYGGFQKIDLSTL